METLSTKVTKINGRYHARLLDGERVIDEMACKLKVDIGYCIAQMMRWHDKMGGSSRMSDASRDRNKGRQPEGKVWWQNELPV